MLGPILIILGVIACCTALAVVGANVGAKNEAPTLAAGMTEQSLRGVMSPSVLGGLLGVIPFLVFVVVLVVMAIQAGEAEAAEEAAAAAEEARDEAASSSAAATADDDAH